MLQRAWQLCCSLKLAIVLASATTLIAMAGSVLIVRRPALFGALDHTTLLNWFITSGRHDLAHSSWLLVSTVLVVLLAVNTLCCVVDWLVHFSARWRKSGEYLIHLGFVLVVIAYGWGSVGGNRASNVAVAVGELIAVPQQPGYFLRLDSFEPQLSASGRPMDLISHVSLLCGDEVIKQAVVRFNHPLTHGGLAILPGSFEQRVNGIRFMSQGQMVDLQRGSVLRLADGSTLSVVEFYPHVEQHGQNLRPRGRRLGNPAFKLQLTTADGHSQRLWYQVRQGLPAQLTERGLTWQPLTPLQTRYSLLTINDDPGAPLAATGGIAMLLGTFIALFSFYAKRRRKDRPEII